MHKWGSFLFFGHEPYSAREMSLDVYIVKEELVELSLLGLVILQGAPKLTSSDASFCPRQPKWNRNQLMACATTLKEHLVLRLKRRGFGRGTGHFFIMLQELVFVA